MVFTDHRFLIVAVAGDGGVAVAVGDGIIVIIGDGVGGGVDFFVAVFAERFSAGTPLSKAALLHQQLIEIARRQVVTHIADRRLVVIRGLAANSRAAAENVPVTVDDCPMIAGVAIHLALRPMVRSRFRCRSFRVAV